MCQIMPASFGRRMLLYALFHICWLSRLEKAPVWAISADTKDPVDDAETNKGSGTTGTGADKNGPLWVAEALREIAYYLRAHKFNDFDRRYETDPERARREHYAAFPRPPLRSLHWEVHRFCEPSFLSCVEYLGRRTRGAGLKRSDDTAVVMQEQHWNLRNDSQQVSPMVRWMNRKIKGRKFLPSCTDF